VRILVWLAILVFIFKIRIRIIRYNEKDQQEIGDEWTQINANDS